MTGVRRCAVRPELLGLLGRSSCGAFGRGLRRRLGRGGLGRRAFAVVAFVRGRLRGRGLAAALAAGLAAAFAALGRGLRRRGAAAASEVAAACACLAGRLRQRGAGLAARSGRPWPYGLAGRDAGLGGLAAAALPVDFATWPLRVDRRAADGGVDLAGEAPLAARGGIRVDRARLRGRSRAEIASLRETAMSLPSVRIVATSGLRDERLRGGPRGWRIARRRSAWRTRFSPDGVRAPAISGAFWPGGGSPFRTCGSWCLCARGRLPAARRRMVAEARGLTTATDGRRQPRPVERIRAMSSPVAESWATAAPRRSARSARAAICVASALPSSTPHWSNESIPQITPWTTPCARTAR